MTHSNQLGSKEGNMSYEMGSVSGLDVAGDTIRGWLEAWYGEELWLNEDGKLFRVPSSRHSFVDIVLETSEDDPMEIPTIHLLCPALINIRYSGRLGMTLLRLNGRMLHGCFMIMPHKRTGTVDVLFRRSFLWSELDQDEFGKALAGVNQVSRDLFPRLARKFKWGLPGDIHGNEVASTADGGDLVH